MQSFMPGLHTSLNVYYNFEKNVMDRIQKIRAIFTEFVIDLINKITNLIRPFDG